MPREKPHGLVLTAFAWQNLTKKGDFLPNPCDRGTVSLAGAGFGRGYTPPVTAAFPRVIPLGGLGEVGKNMTVFEHQGASLVIDAGLAFPRDEHLGVDLVLPDFSYLRDRPGELRAVVLTHAHEDHVGALPYLMREVQVPEVWATRLTLGLVKSKLDEHGLLRAAELREIDPEGDPLQLGPFRLEFVRMAHSIPDNVAVLIETDAGRLLHTSDWKLDHTPVDGFRTDVGRLTEIGNRGVDLLLCDSTNAERPGFTGSERLVGEAFRQIIPQRQGRVLVASFASNVHRMQQAIDVAVQTGRKVAVVGRSMRKNLNIAGNLGYLEVPDGTLIQPKELDEYQPHEVLILCTGSQGEPMSALTRIAYRDHQTVSVERGDTVIISARPVPGNELRVHDTINQLSKAGAEVLHEENALVHVSGHANQEEIRTLYGLVRPKAVMPIHGEYRMQAANARMAREAGVPADSIVLAENGSVVELGPNGASIVDQVEAGVTLVDGLGVGDIGDVALRDRRHMAEDGVLIIVATLASQNGARSAAAEVIARGFAETEPLLDEMRAEAESVLRECLDDNIVEIKLLQEHLHDGVGQLVYDRTKRRPMILPVVVEV
jgi:ribonuclease J